CGNLKRDLAIRSPFYTVHYPTVNGMMSGVGLKRAMLKSLLAPAQQFLHQSKIWASLSWMKSMKQVTNKRTCRGIMLAMLPSGAGNITIVRLFLEVQRHRLNPAHVLRMVFTND